MIFLGPVRVGVTLRPGRERRVDRHLLARRRARQHPEHRRRVLQRRHDLFQRRHDDVDLGQRLAEITIALVGHDH